MRGTRAKRLRTEERPNPGRKHGGANKPARERTRVLDKAGRKAAFRKALRGY